MKIVHSLFALGLCALVAACSGDDGAIKIEAAQAPLTENGGDVLFTVDLVSARSDGYDMKAFRVHVTPPTDVAKESDVTCTVQDVNTNQKLDQGDKLSCVEGVANTFGTAVAGKDSAVEMFATIDGKEERIGSATWTAPTTP